MRHQPLFLFIFYIFPYNTFIHTFIRRGSTPQSRQSAKRFSSRWNWDSPFPFSCRRVCPPPVGPGGRAHSLAAKGVGESQFQQGDIHCGALYIKVLCGPLLFPHCSSLSRGPRCPWGAESGFELGPTRTFDIVRPLSSLYPGYLL